MFELRELINHFGWDYTGSHTHIQQVSTDSRTLGKNSLFVALTGDRFDGHNYLDSAFGNGAISAVVCRGTCVKQWPGKSFVFVDDTLLALQKIAKWWRSQLDTPVIAVVGSNGKTTTREMIHAIFKSRFGDKLTHCSKSNYNNEIGLPLSILDIRQQHKISILEIGMNHRGETERLSEIAAPNLVLINNAQREHQLYLKNVFTVAEEHGDVIKGLQNDGIVVLNHEDDYFDYWHGLAQGHQVISFGMNAGSYVQGQINTKEQRIHIQGNIGKQQDFTIHLSILGGHNGLNALAAIAASVPFNLPINIIIKGLESFTAVDGRLKVMESARAGTIIDDSYNANPDSYRAAIDVLHDCGGKTLLIMGDMDEAGDASENIMLHAEIGEYAKARGIMQLITIGDNSLHATKAFGANAKHYISTEDLITYVSSQDSPDAVILVKGSRFMRMEKLVNSLTLRELTVPQEKDPQGR